MDKCLITACSNKYYPSVLNLIGSLKANYPLHPPLYIYDLGLAPVFKRQLEKIADVKVLAQPNFCSFWKSCYTWKTYIFTVPLADLNFYLDAGGLVLAPLDEIFSRIEADDYFALTVDPKLPLEKITPREFKPLFKGAEKFYSSPCLAAGIFGFKRNSRLTKILETLRAAAEAGLTLGFSPDEKWRNRGKNKNQFTRDCQIFRHDQTLLNLLMRQELGNFYLHTQVNPDSLGASQEANRDYLIHLPKPLINILGSSYEQLEYAPLIFSKNKKIINGLLNLFLFLKAARLRAKRLLKMTRN